ncbi:MAG: uncharacterized protein KVP18_003434, partial [Porospora cf. gigantea A]|uniref:uncharacterized protein n=1 Tax=Porospora cf. gigantea A TaxID=2853593 RepID=UPI00355998E0
MCDSPSVCSKRKDEFDLLIGTIVEGLVVDHNPYTGGCELRKTEETCICANGNSNHPRIPDRCVDVRECAQNPCSGNAYTGQCIERWGSYECVCIPSEAVHPLSGGVPDLRRCVSAENCDDNPPPCISRKREWEPRIGISYLGKVVSHNPYTGRCGSRLAVWSECECTAGYSHNTSRWNLLDCRDVNQCGPNTCTKSHLQTGVCREMHGSYECVCSSFGEHPASGGFNNGKNWTACQPALKCRSGVCQQQKDGFSQQTDPLIVHNAYSGGCTDDPLYGATCKCNPGFANRGGVNSTTCEDIKECEAGKCPDDGTYTGECREMIGTHECVCHDPQGKHPDTGGFNATTRENTEKDWSKCEPAIQCETGVCPRLKEEFAPRVERPDVLHNAYSGTCVFDPVFGATCVCHPGFRNLGGLRSTECEDVKECNAPENCPPTLFYTGQCKELIGSFECLCRDVGAHPTFGGFVPEIGGP